MFKKEEFRKKLLYHFSIADDNFKSRELLEYYMGDDYKVDIPENIIQYKTLFNLLSENSKLSLFSSNSRQAIIYHLENVFKFSIYDPGQNEGILRVDVLFSYDEMGTIKIIEYEDEGGIFVYYILFGDRPLSSNYDTNYKYMAASNIWYYNPDTVEIFKDDIEGWETFENIERLCIDADLKTEVAVYNVEPIKIKDILKEVHRAQEKLKDNIMYKQMVKRDKQQ